MLSSTHKRPIAQGRVTKKERERVAFNGSQYIVFFSSFHRIGAAPLFTSTYSLRVSRYGCFYLFFAVPSVRSK